MQQLMQVTLENDSLLLLSFRQSWQQDDIQGLANLVFNNIDNAQIIERVIGADREYFRFRIATNYLILHFESYANSCWIEGEDQLPTPAITEIYHLLNRYIIR